MSVVRAAPLVGETVLGDVYRIRIITGWNPFPRSCVDLEIGSPSVGSLTLAPDEARALAGELVRWAGHAEREGRGRP